ncbi:hypothetical protein [Mesorhizobium sp.]|uniref:hypothetical protein n=1 Tax=Mesorhizobium sp. TaxID=1871066 RepID=UPI0025BC9675|nr:hypothetical protein [Mesorhizobium sp.]
MSGWPARPVREGFIEHSTSLTRPAALWLEGELVHLEDLVLHDAHMDIRTMSTRGHTRCCELVGEFFAKAGLGARPGRFFGPDRPEWRHAEAG